jgi:hypothetical protein
VHGRVACGEPTIVDVWITAKENGSGCFATASLKTSRILNPPL